MAPAGSPDTWNWEVIGAWCRRIATRYAGRDAADDIAQEAVLRAWRGRDGCRDPGRPWAWLAQITRNEALRAAARRPPEAGGDDALPEPACPVSPGVVVEERLDLDAALAGLPALDRVLVGLYYECDLSVSAVADLAGLSPGAVKVRLHRARAALRSVLEPDNRC